MPHSNKVLCCRGKRTKTNTSTRKYYSETTTHTKTGTKRGGDCANSCHTPTKYCAIEGKGQSSNSTPTSSITSSSSASSSDRSSSRDVKAAVENIQAMFAAYLEQHQSSSSSDESNT